MTAPPFPKALKIHEGGPVSYTHLIPLDEEGEPAMKKSDVRQLTRRTDPLMWPITILTFGGYGVLLGLNLPAIQPWRNLPAALAVRCV